MADVFSQMGAANNKVAKAKEQRRREEMAARQKEMAQEKARAEAAADARQAAQEKARAVEAERQEKLAREAALKKQAEEAAERERKLREQQEREAQAARAQAEQQAARIASEAQVSSDSSVSNTEDNQGVTEAQNVSYDEYDAQEAALAEARARAKAQAAANRKKAVEPTIEDLVKAEDELYVEKKGRRVSPALWRNPNDEALTKPMTLRPFPRPLVDMLSVAYGANAQNMSATQVVAVACAIALDLTEDEASEIFATAYNDDKAFGVFKAVKRDISTQAGVEHWASRIEKRLDDIAFNVDAAKIAALRNVIDYNGGLDTPGAGSNISYENDAVLRGCDKLDEDVKSIRQRQIVKKGRK